MTDQERGEKMRESYEQTIQYWPPSSTSNPVKLVGVPFCPDLLKYDDIGAADGWRGRVIRLFFWCLRWWKP